MINSNKTKLINSSIPDFSALVQRKNSERSVQEWNWKFIKSFKKPSVRGALQRSYFRRQWNLVSIGEEVAGVSVVTGEFQNIRPSSQQDADILLSNFKLLAKHAKRQGGIGGIAIIANGTATISIPKLGLTVTTEMLEVR